MRRRIFLTLLLVATILRGSVAVALPPRPSVVVLVSPGATAYREASEAAVASLQAALGDCEVETVLLDDSEDSAHAERLVSGRPSLVLAIGSRAAKLGLSRTPGVPLVYAMVLDPGFVGLPVPGENPRESTTGVTMDVDPDEQFELVRQIMPSARRLGVLYDPTISGPAVRRATAAAKAHGLELVAQSVRGEGEVMGAAALLVPHVDALWALADPTVFTAANARGLILLSLRSKKPLFAMSEGYVRSGAIAALSADPREVGRRAGELARKVLDGLAFREIRPEMPPVLSVFVNRATAERLGVSLPAAVVARARIVFPES